MENGFEKEMKSLVTFEIKKLITKVFKYNLIIVEDLREHHIIALKKAKNLNPEEVEFFNYLDFNKYSLLRKRILDNGNESVRDLENFLENFDFSLKNREASIEYTKEKGKNYDKQ